MLAVSPHAAVKIIAYVALLMVLRGSLAGQVLAGVEPYLLPLCVTNDCNPGFQILGSRRYMALRCGENPKGTERPSRELSAAPRAGTPGRGYYLKWSSGKSRVTTGRLAGAGAGAAVRYIQ